MNEQTNSLVPQQTIQEVQGWFPDIVSLQAATSKLVLALYEQSDFSLLEQ